MQANDPTLNALLEQISGGNPEAVIRIQMDRSVVYKGTVTEAPTNGLTASQIADLTEVLTTPAGQPTALKSALAISCDGQTLFRSTAKAGITVNHLVNSAVNQAVHVPLLVRQPETDLEPATEPALSVPSIPPLQPDYIPPVLAKDTAPAEALEPAAPFSQSAPVGLEQLDPPPNPRTTLSASEVVIIEMHDRAVGAQTLQWICDQIPALKQSQLVQSLQTEGVQATRSALKQAATLTRSTADKALGDSIVALTRQYGQVRDLPEGKRFVYEAEHYKVMVQGTNHYTLSDPQGKILFAFRHTPLQVKPTAPCQLSLSQSFEILRAGASLQANQTKQTVKNSVEALSSMAQSLAGIAPAGTFDRLDTLQQQQAVKVAELLSDGKHAITTAGGRMFTGTHFKVFHTPESLRVFATDGRSELLFRVGNQIRSRMNGTDLAQTGKVAQTLFKAMQHQVLQQIHQNMHGSPKVGSGR